LNKQRRAPAEWVLPIERATREAGNEVSRHELRPDIYPVEPKIQAAE
jgi:DNA-binding transcriptional regulator YdaS (Cro superfamily)